MAGEGERRMVGMKTVRTAMIAPGSELNHSMKRSVVEEGVLVSSGPESTDIMGVPPSAP
jgi:hypothetical protein